MRHERSKKRREEVTVDVSNVHREGAKQSQCPQICYWVVTVNQMNRLYLFFQSELIEPKVERAMLALIT